ncbi:5-formyltetrahydrofolate cyclo-ligase [Trueperella sp. LYQ141]|uniref:5-formyltetrahydrofolate cyclo-ligase n=1 Tax=Trueperella sp. LYQ141 TaxID=3391058 RepID=UPI003983C39B
MSIPTLRIPNLAAADVEEGKQLLRSAIREHRKQRSRKLLERLGQSWAQTILPLLDGRHRVACYVSTGFEPPSLPTILVLHESGKEILLPKLGPGLSRCWGIFTDVDSLVNMAPGRPPEPDGPAYPNEILHDVDALIIPALAVSRQGARLGQGGGWYDRALKKAHPNALIGAMIFDEELLSEEIPQDEMDVRVPYVFHPEQVIRTATA